MHIYSFLNNFYINYPIVVKIIEITWLIIDIVFTKNELSYIKITLGIQLFSGGGVGRN